MSFAPLVPMFGHNSSRYFVIYYHVIGRQLMPKNRFQKNKEEAKNTSNADGPKSKKVVDESNDLSFFSDQSKSSNQSKVSLHDSNQFQE